MFSQWRPAEVASRERLCRGRPANKRGLIRPRAGSRRSQVGFSFASPPWALLGARARRQGCLPRNRCETGSLAAGWIQPSEQMLARARAAPIRLINGTSLVWRVAEPNKRALLADCCSAAQPTDRRAPELNIWPPPPPPSLPRAGWLRVGANLGCQASAATADLFAHLCRQNFSRSYAAYERHRRALSRPAAAHLGRLRWPG